MAAAPLLPSDNLEPEISMLREMLLSIFNKTKSEEDLKIRLRSLDVFSLACSRLAAILKAHRFLASDKTAANLIDEALAEVFEELAASGFPKEEHG